MPTVTAYPNVAASSTTQTGLTARPSGVAWTNVNNVKADDASTATNANTANAGYQFIVTSDFRVGGTTLANLIPPSSIITGVTVGFKGTGPSFQTFSDLRARLTGSVYDELSGEIAVGDVESNYVGSQIPNTESVRDSSFGVVVGIEGDGNDATVQVVYLKITYMSGDRRARTRTTMRAS